MKRQIVLAAAILAALATPAAADAAPSAPAGPKKVRHTLATTRAEPRTHMDPTPAPRARAAPLVPPRPPD